jgi:hypothetical protein
MTFANLNSSHGDLVDEPLALNDDQVTGFVYLNTWSHGILQQFTKPYRGVPKVWLPRARQPEEATIVHFFSTQLITNYTHPRNI